MTRVTTADENWQATRRLFRVLREIPMKLEPVPVATVWVKVPDAIAEWPKLVDSVAAIAAQEVISRDYPELWRHGVRILSWSAYSLDLRWIDSQDNFGEASNRCLVWLTGPHPALTLSRASRVFPTNISKRSLGLPVA
jgi:hypothetical protein